MTEMLNLFSRVQVSSTLLVNDHDLITGLYQGSIEVTSLHGQTRTSDDVDQYRLSDNDTRHKGEIWSVKLFANNERLLTVGHDRSFKIFDFKQKKLVYTKKQAHRGRIRCCDVSADGRFIVTGARDKAIRLFRVSDGQMLSSVNMYEDIYELSFGLNGRVVIALIHRFGERRLAIFSILGLTDELCE